MIYLDYAAATPVDERVIKAMQPYWHDQFFNPSATYLASRGVAQAVADARQKVASIIGARPTEVIFTAGATESDNLAIHGVMRRYPAAKLLVSEVEHEAVLQVAHQYNHQLIPVDKNGRIDLEKLATLIDDQTVLISVMYANNEVGTIQPINQVTQLVKTVRQARVKKGIELPLYVHTDASQAANYLDLHASRLGIDLMTLNGGKTYGPKQTGALFVKAGLELAPLITGGGQENGVRSGTENVPGIIGFAKALEIAQDMRKAEAERLQTLQKFFETELEKIAPNAVINSRGSRLPNLVHVTFPDTDNERLMMQLDEQDILCAVGSACSASNDEASHVLMAMGLTEAEAQSSLRFSMGRQTTKKDLETVISAIHQLITQK